jgi:hypothetical protein
MWRISIWIPDTALALRYLGAAHFRIGHRQTDRFHTDADKMRLPYVYITSIAEVTTFGAPSTITSTNNRSAMMPKLRVDRIIDAADPSDVEDIELRRRIAEALLAGDLDLSQIAGGGAARRHFPHGSCRAWRARRAQPAASRRPHVDAASWCSCH